MDARCTLKPLALKEGWLWIRRQQFLGPSFATLRHAILPATGTQLPLGESFSAIRRQLYTAYRGSLRTARSEILSTVSLNHTVLQIHSIDGVLTWADPMWGGRSPQARAVRNSSQNCFIVLRAAWRPTCSLTRASSSWYCASCSLGGSHCNRGGVDGWTGMGSSRDFHVCSPACASTCRHHAENLVYHPTTVRSRNDDNLDVHLRTVR